MDNKFTIRELMAAILNSDLDTIAKTDFLTSISTSLFVTDGLYLKKTDDGMVECWYRNVDENGVTDHGKTNFTVDQVIEEFKRSRGVSK
jgi:hypothetical protein